MVLKKSEMLHLTLIQNIARMPERNYKGLLTDIFVLITSIPVVFVFHRQYEQCSSINDMFDEVSEQTPRDCRTDTF